MLRLIVPNISNLSKESLWHDAIRPNLPLLLILLALFVVSIIWLVGLFQWKNNIRIKGTVKKNKTKEMAVFFLTYIVPLVFIDITWVNFAINGVVFLFCGIALFIASDEHFLNPTFLLFGYKLYKLDDKFILSKKSFDALKIELIENPDGICAREIVQNTYIVLSK